MRFCGSCGRHEFLFGDAERSEDAFGLGLAPSVVDTGKIDVLPDLWGDVANYVIRQVMPFVPQSEDAAVERRDLLQRTKDIGPQVREAMRAAVERVRAYRERGTEKATTGRHSGRRM